MATVKNKNTVIFSAVTEHQFILSPKQRALTNVIIILINKGQVSIS